MMGAEIYLYLEYKTNKMTARVASTSKAHNGDTITVAFDPHKIHLFDPETELTILN
jgi:multiple sugar transport system ATP-binding protein